MNRREALKGVLLVSTGATIGLLGASEILGYFSPKSTANAEGRGAFTVTPDNTSVATTASSINQTRASTYVTIKVGYFGMSAQMTGGKQEEFALQSPAFLQDLISQVRQEHEAFATMLPTMQIVMDGEPTQGNPQLPDKAEVDFIPVYAGG